MASRLMWFRVGKGQWSRSKKSPTRSESINAKLGHGRIENSAGFKKSEATTPCTCYVVVSWQI